MIATHAEYSRRDQFQRKSNGNDLGSIKSSWNAGSIMCPRFIILIAVLTYPGCRKPAVQRTVSSLCAIWRSENLLLASSGQFDGGWSRRKSVKIFIVRMCSPINIAKASSWTATVWKRRKSYWPLEHVDRFYSFGPVNPQESGLLKGREYHHSRRTVKWISCDQGGDTGDWE